MTTKKMMQAQCRAHGVPLTVREQARAVAERCADAYSFDRYANWAAVAEMLLRAGFNEHDAEVVLRSKWTRWAGDASDKPHGRCTSKDLERWIEESSTRAGQTWHEMFRSQLATGR